MASLAVSSFLRGGNFVVHCNSRGDVWEEFRRWLRARGFSAHYVANCVGYARRYAHVLGSGRLSDLAGVPGRKHALRALANFCKFLGVYGQFRRMREESGLSWSDGSNGNGVFEILLGGKENAEQADVYLRQIMNANVCEDVKRFARFLYMSGLRPCEALLVFKFMAEKREGYLDEEKLLLHHWRFPEFQRGGKRCFLTVLTPKMVEDLKQGLHGNWYYEKIKRHLHRAGLAVNLYIFRKGWSTKMRMSGIEQELVSFFQGRSPRTVFEQSYFRPVLESAISKVRRILEDWELRFFE